MFLILAPITHSYNIYKKKMQVILFLFCNPSLLFSPEVLQFLLTIKPTSIKDSNDIQSMIFKCLSLGDFVQC